MKIKIKPSLFFLLLLHITIGKSQTLIINATANPILSEKQTFALGFFNLNSNSSHYLGIWYASIPIRTYVWVANRQSPIPFPGKLSLTPSGHLSIISDPNTTTWTSENTLPAASFKFLDTGNLILLSSENVVVWQSFDFPTDTWLPNMTVTNSKKLVSWKSPTDPSPGNYIFRLRPPEYGEFELVFNDSVKYWSTGNWIGNRFTNVPEMTIPYIYDFQFLNPFTPDASFKYSQNTNDNVDGKMLTRFVLDSSGQVMQYTWSEQSSSWNMFWSRPESPCKVYGRCGKLGFCSTGLSPCECIGETHPMDYDSWNSGDFSGGCEHGVGGDDVFIDVGKFDFDGVVMKSVLDINFEGCKGICLGASSCFGIRYELQNHHCVALNGDAMNLRNSTTSPVLYLRVTKLSSKKKPLGKSSIVTIAIGVSLVCSILTASTVIVFRRSGRSKELKRNVRKCDEEDGMNLRVFTYKELSSATNNFTEKLGHGGFGAVFLGKLPDSTAIAVKRLERPNGGDREFRAEIKTIGNVHHVNLVRLRGFCSEDPHRMLVYEYVQNGPLSSYLIHDRTVLSWRVRMDIAVGVAKAVAYLHEECRECIIHCDIKPENILLGEGFGPKLSDFGLAKLVGREFSRVQASVRGTWGYVAPEWVSGAAITANADVYSYGMTLMEILSGRRNVRSMEEACFWPPEAARKVVEGDVAAVVDPELGSEWVAEEAERAARVAVWCVQDEEAVRPSMGTVVKMLEGTVGVTAPPMPMLLEKMVEGDSFGRVGSNS